MSVLPLDSSTRLQHSTHLLHSIADRVSALQYSFAVFPVWCVPFAFRLIGWGVFWEVVPDGGRPFLTVVIGPDLSPRPELIARRSFLGIPDPLVAGLVAAVDASAPLLALGLACISVPTGHCGRWVQFGLSDWSLESCFERVERDVGEVASFHPIFAVE